MTYSSCINNPCMSNCSTAVARRLDNIVNKFYINIGELSVHNGNINNGIQHSIAAQQTGDIHVYSQTLDNHVDNHFQNNYIINLDNRKVEFVSGYIGESNRQKSYLEHKTPYLLPAPKSGNSQKQTSSESYQSMLTSGLLNSRRPVTQWIGDAKEIEEITIETFEKLTSQPFPDDIVIRVCTEEEMKRAHSANGGLWSSGIMGFALNHTNAPSLVFIKQNHLDALMLTLGHELGHVLTARLPNDHDEEAKAFAFELAWVKTIIENNIGNLAQSFNIDFMPAQNGLHDKAFAFVQERIKSGMKNTTNKAKVALKTFWEIAKGVLRMSASS